MFVESLLQNVMHPPVMFFILGLTSVMVRSNLEIPSQISKFLSLYLLFDIGIHGGEALFKSGLDPHMIVMMLVCISVSFLMPFGLYKILRFKLKPHDASAIAATYGSVSAVTFATAVSFLGTQHTEFSGYMVACMALMESPAIIAGLLLYQLSKTQRKEALAQQGAGELQEPRPSRPVNIKAVLHEAFLNGSVLLLVGSLVIGILGGKAGAEELKPFVDDIFKGVLSFYMLDMGIIAAKRFSDFKESSGFLISFGLLYPLVGASVGLGLARLLNLHVGDALILMVLISSASYVAVPAAMRTAIPKANMSLLLPVALGVTFTFNVTFGIPLYFYVLKQFIH
jgi:hypothetical protein